MDYWVKILLCFFVAIVVGGQAASLHDHNSLPSYHEDVPEAVISDLHEVLKIFLPQPHPTQASSPAAPSASTSASSYPSPSVLPPCYRKSGTKFDFSQYWVPKEGQWDETADRERIFLGDNGKPISILDAVGQVIANVSSGTLDKCASEHTCLLSNGALVHLSKKKKDKIPIFEIIGKPGRQRNLFGFGSGRQNLVPYVSVAVNGLPEGTTLYIPDMDGIILPSGQQHNGCVRVDDRRSSSSPQDACHIDMFVATYVDYLMLNVRDSVSARVQPCTVQNYVTRDHLAYMHADTSDAVIMMALNDTREEEL